MAVIPAGHEGWSASFEEVNRRFRLQRLKWAIVVSVAVYLLAATLDVFYYPGKQLEFWVVRAGVSVILLGILWLLMTPNGIRHVVKCGLAWALILGVAINYMIFSTDGASSPYYAALHLVVLGMGFMMVWTVSETLVTAFGIIALYWVACWGNEVAMGGSVELKDLYLGSFFLTATSIISAISAHFSMISRRQDHLLTCQLDEQNRRLQELDRQKSDFFANISHELRTPLTLVYAPIERMLRDSESLPGKAHEELMLAHRNTLRLLKLINEVLDILKLDQGSMVLRRQRVVISDYVRGVVRSVSHLGLAKGIRVDIETREEALEMYVDPDRFEKVLLNLVVNAIKFSKEGGVVQVRWSTDGPDLRFEVEDHGIGIPVASHQRVFERFFQVDSSTTRRYGGTGLGLALAHELVERHGGRISFKSEEGRGTVFSVWIPAGIPSCPLAELEGSGCSPEPMQEVFKTADRFLNLDVGDGLPKGAQAGCGEHRILVVDDEADMRRFLLNNLKDSFRISLAANGKDALELARDLHPNLMILDWMMPEMDGLEVCQRIKSEEATRDIRVIMLTARSDEVSKIQALESGADDFLLKPFSSIELIARVRSCLREADLRNDLRDQNVYLKKTLADLESTRLQLVHSEKMAGIGCLASGILHEINNPLNYMLTALDLGIGSANRLDSGNLPDLLADVKRGAERIQEIVSNLGVFALSENSDRKSPCAMGELASKAVQMLPPDLPRNRITVDIPGDLVIVGFQTQLVHVLLNLLRNAMDAVSGDSYRDRAKVILRASRMDSDKIRVSVEDNGCGIPESNMKRIFEPFFTTKDVNQGTGLGLSVCHSIIKAHGSDLAVRSRVGEGSCFSFELPDKDIC